MLKLKLQYFGHLMQRTDSEKTLLLGKIKGKRRRVQQRMRQLDNISDSMDMSLSKLQTHNQYIGFTFKLKFSNHLTSISFQVNPFYGQRYHFSTIKSALQPSEVSETKPDIRTQQRGSRTLDFTDFCKDSTLVRSFKNCQCVSHNLFLMMNQTTVKILH